MYQDPRSYKLNLENSNTVLILYSKSDKNLDKQRVDWWTLMSWTEFSNWDWMVSCWGTELSRSCTSVSNSSVSNSALRKSERGVDGPPQPQSLSHSPAKDAVWLQLRQIEMWALPTVLWAINDCKYTECTNRTAGSLPNPLVWKRPRLEKSFL